VNEYLAADLRHEVEDHALHRPQRARRPVEEARGHELRAVVRVVVVHCKQPVASIMSWHVMSCVTSGYLGVHAGIVPLPIVRQGRAVVIDIDIVDPVGVRVFSCMHTHTHTHSLSPLSLSRTHTRT